MVEVCDQCTRTNCYLLPVLVYSFPCKRRLVDFILLRVRVQSILHFPVHLAKNPSPTKDCSTEATVQTSRISRLESQMTAQLLARDQTVQPHSYLHTAPFALLSLSDPAAPLGPQDQSALSCTLLSLILTVFCGPSRPQTSSASAQPGSHPSQPQGRDEAPAHEDAGRCPVLEPPPRHHPARERAHKKTRTSHSLF